MENKRWTRAFMGVIPPFALFVIVLFFPYQIAIIDALTVQPLAEYGIHIHFWRIVFEPFLGPLLYFNRAINPLQELPIAVMWILVLYLVYGLMQLKPLQSILLRRKKLLRILGNLPLLVGIGFGIFVILLFIPLPNNTIVNNSQNDILVTTHTHTEYSHDGLTSQKNMWKWHKRNGFDAFFITDHANHKKTLEFSEQQRNNKFPLKPLVLVGQEHSGSNHMSLLGLDGSFVTKDKPDSSIVKLTHKYGGAVIVNHWFDGKGKEKEFYKALGVDGFEIENVGKELYYDRSQFRELKKYCEENGLIMVGGLDYHGYGRVCAIWNAFTIPNWSGMDPDHKESAILQILRERDQSKLKVLMYRDRPLNEGLSPLFGPIVTVVNYFRTLNSFQVVSWILWWGVLQLFLKFKKANVMGWDKTLAIAGGANALFLLVLGVLYFLRGQVIEGYSDLYDEYSSLLFIIGGVLAVYSAMVIYSRFFAQQKIGRKE
ncbi:hypothetical protein KCTC52924_02176 [Arenibacter antarcticus]|uniref:PHP domain-containing protein n=1 Tax=Arenibacter antarcticus TaxID=2040469 RepID=A0ABW5VCS2_9FLAO|nr:PHP domain-containing protein [Arenibacter sp. H213]MCM4168598.1 hypothetical protein [Arenibacter sp. H213]